MTDDMHTWLESLELRDATVLANDVVTPRMHRLVLDATHHPVVQGYDTPGQFVALSAEGVAPRFYALASHPRDLPQVEFLIGRAVGPADALCACEPGERVAMSVASGAGYRMEMLRDRPVVVFTTGTGLASVRPVIRDLVDAGAGARVSVYYGATSAADFALSDEMDAWARAGAAVVRVRDDATDGPRFVQEAWIAAHGDADATGAEYVVCGSRPMQAAVVAALEARGVAPERVHFNY